MTIEIWKEVLGYEGLYEVSNLGNLRAPAKITVHGHKRKEKMLIPQKGWHGYLKVSLRKNNIVSVFQMHQLVAESFLKKEPSHTQVNHIDGNKTNNRTDNLEWCTGSENVQHAYDTGLMTKRKGEKHPLSRLTEKDVIEIRSLIKSLNPYKDIASKFNITVQTVCDIKHKRSWSHV